VLSLIDAREVESSLGLNARLTSTACGQ
jgi:hypothetical protein